MRLGILIIGSLVWDPSPVRCRWRQARLSCADKHQVMVPIRYGKKSTKRKHTYTMVFARSCCDPRRLGTALVVAARAECREPEHLFEEAEHLWAAERDVAELGGLGADWGKVCLLKNPRIDAQDNVLQAWQARIESLGNAYAPLPSADGEQPVLDSATGLALFDWPKEVSTRECLAGFDILLMTATKPTLNAAGQYPTPKEVAEAWRADGNSNVLYFYNNRHHGITTFEDDQIQGFLRGEQPNE